MDLVAPGRVAVGIEIGRDCGPVARDIEQVGHVGSLVAIDSEIAVNIDNLDYALVVFSVFYVAVAAHQ